MLREQVEVLQRENSILKRAVAIQHERQKVYDERNQEVQHLKQLISQYQEQLRTLEVKHQTLSTLFSSEIITPVDLWAHVNVLDLQKARLLNIKWNSICFPPTLWTAQC